MLVYKTAYQGSYYIEQRLQICLVEPHACASMGVGWGADGGQENPLFDLHVHRHELVGCIRHSKLCFSIAHATWHQQRANQFIIFVGCSNPTCCIVTRATLQTAPEDRLQHGTGNAFSAGIAVSRLNSGRGLTRCNTFDAVSRRCFAYIACPSIKPLFGPGTVLVLHN